MKTAESSIKSDLGKFIVDLAIEKFHNWADTEFNYLRHTSNFPVCVPLSSKSWVIANFQLDQLGQHQWKISTNDELVHIFYSKQAAVLYAVYTKFKWYKTADKILFTDRQVAKLSDEMQFYSSRLSKASDSFKYQLWFTKYSEVKSKYQVAKLEQEQTLSAAKAKFTKNVITDK